MINFQAIYSGVDLLSKLDNLAEVDMYKLILLFGLVLFREKCAGN